MVELRRRSDIWLDHHVGVSWGSMARSALTLAAVAVAMSICLSGCVPTIVSTKHEYVLVLSEGDAFLVLMDDDPLYVRFESEVLSDRYLYLLLMTYEHATESFLATNSLSSLSQTVANKPVIVLNSSAPTVLRDIELEYGQVRVPVELAMGLGDGGDVDLGSARGSFARVMAPLLLELMGLGPGQGGQADHTTLYETITPSAAFRAGFQAAIEARHAQEDPELIRGLREEEPQSPELRDRLYRYELVPSNGFRFRFDDDAPTSEALPYEERLRRPGVIATFFYRLLRETESFYPQRYMLWFVNFEPEETNYAKVLLAVNRMAQDDGGSVEAFLRSYIETFPVEKGFLLRVAGEVFGSEVSGSLKG
jgi:hypothetical protein